MSAIITVVVNTNNDTPDAQQRYIKWQTIATWIHNMKQCNKCKTYSACLKYIHQCRSCPCSVATIRWVPTYSMGKGERRVSYRLSINACPAVQLHERQYKTKPNLYAKAQTKTKTQTRTQKIYITRKSKSNLRKSQVLQISNSYTFPFFSNYFRL